MFEYPVGHSKNLTEIILSNNMKKIFPTGIYVKHVTFMLKTNIFIRFY